MRCASRLQPSLLLRCALRLQPSLPAPAALFSTAPARPPPPAAAPRPQMPDPGECCGNDCRDCVLDEYAAELKAWQDAQAAALQAAAPAPGAPGEDAAAPREAQLQ